MKSSQSRRNKAKGTEVNKRVKAETAGSKEEIRSLKEDLKGIYSKYRISKIFNTEYFFTMYMPDGVGDFLVIFLSIAVVLAIPPIIYLFALPEENRKLWWLLLLYLGIAGAAFGIFYLIYCKVRKKHINELREAKKIRDKIKFAKKVMKKTEKNIRKDKDESKYGLERFDEEISGLETGIDSLIEQKKQALAEFENTTKNEIIRSVNDQYDKEIASMKQQNEYAFSEQRSVEATIKSMSLEISSKYGAYIGQDKLNIQTIDSLIEIINGGDALNIADALAFYKKSQEKA